MSSKAQAILDEVKALSPSEQQELWRELGRRIGHTPTTGSPVLYGEPLSDEDIEESARVTFQMLDEGEKRGEPR